MPMLDFRVETFLAVCRHMNFTKAARELNITQPAVSHHMHYLEQAYGTALFQHNGKRLQLTEAGEILRRTLMTMKHDEQHLQKRMQQVVSGTRDYSFGATLSVAEFMINEALGRFLRLHPDSHIQMQVADTKVLLSKLDSGELDFARTVEIGNIGAIKTLLKSGYGVSFLYRAAIRPEEAAGALGVIELSDFELRHDIMFLFPKNSNFRADYTTIFRELRACAEETGGA